MPSAPSLAEFGQLVRTLSHDMTANFHLLAHSLGRLKQRCGQHPVPELNEGVSHVEACLTQSKRLLEELGLLGRTGRVDMQPARVELGPVIRDALANLAPLVAQQGVQIVLGDLSWAVWIHPCRARQLVDNVLHNALRYGCTAKRPRITIETLPGERAGYVRLRIADNGRGIPARHREKVFLPGERLDAADSVGSGLGLAIVKWIVRHYGGEAHIEDCRPSGTAVVMSLPAPPGD